jgi:hypothetical protein
MPITRTSPFETKKMRLYMFDIKSKTCLEGSQEKFFQMFDSKFAGFTTKSQTTQLGICNIELKQFFLLSNEMKWYKI